MKYLFILFMFFSVGMWGQEPISRKELTEKEQKSYKKALDYSRQGRYDKSDKELKKLLKKRPAFVDGMLLQAGNAYNSQDKKKAILIFEKVVAKYPDYNPMTYYSLAITQREIDDFENAAANFGKFVAKNPDHKKAVKAKRLQELSAFAAKAIKNPVPFKPEKLKGINTDANEYLPVVSVDGETMVFTRRVAGQEDFFKAEMQGDSVTSVIPMTGLNTPYNEGVHTVSADGNKIIYTACDRKKAHSGCDLFYREWRDGQWTDEINMGSDVNTSAWDAQPSLSANGNVLLFTSNRKGSRGKDIWITVKTDTSGWVRPRPLSDVINTDGDEESPFLHPDGQTLYFRSNKHTGMGGFDIFYSRYNIQEKRWETPVNIGFPINTKGDEGALTVSLDGKTAYFASDQAYDGKGKKNLDILKFDLYPEARPFPTTFVKINVTDAETGLPLAYGYELINVTKNFITARGSTYDGTFVSALPAYSEYACIIDKEGYIYHSENFNLTEVKSALEPYVLNIKLEKYEPKIVANSSPSQPVIMKNIFFDTGKSTLKPSSDFEIGKLYDLLNSTDAKVEIIGHTDNVGDENANLRLSQARANAVKNRLISMGISSYRIQATGRGENQPIGDNTTEEGRKLNRRTEFLILK